MLFIFLAIIATTTISATNRALLVGISDYGNPRGNYPDRLWRNINGANDVELLKPSLEKRNFKVQTLIDNEATKAGIVSALKRLAKESKKGDVIYLHFSMHGQLVEEGTKWNPKRDEKDGWDEALVPVDAKMKYTEGVYWGQNHLLDDELRPLIDKIRKAVGPKGIVYVALDACHAGGSARGDEPVRGTQNPFTPSGLTYKNTNKPRWIVSTASEQSPVVFLEACKSNEANKEIRISIKPSVYCGRLTYYINKVISQHTIVTSTDWTLEVQRQMNTPNATQTMIIEKSKIIQ